MLLGYRYSKKNDFYYTDNSYAWQKPFGFTQLYDSASQLIGYQYDFKRVSFNYGNRDWLVEFWKGQYALFKFGAEIGVYTKPDSGFGDTAVSAYKCASQDELLNMEMTLYHDKEDGTMCREFTCDYDSYWWCAGFKIGRLNQSKPAKELQMVSRITLYDEKMTTAFVEGMKECGFTQVASRDLLTDDTFCCEGHDVYLKWRNLTESQSLIPITINGESTGFLQIIMSGLGLFLEAFIDIFGVFIYIFKGLFN